MTAATSLAETLATVLGEHQWQDWSCSCGAVNAATCTTEDEHLSVVLAEAARAWLVTRLADDDAQERVARNLAGMADGDDWPTNELLGGGLTGTRDDEYRDAMHLAATDVLAALAGVLTK